MKRTFLVLLILIFVSLGAKPDTIEKELKVSMGKKLELDLKTGGAIDITGWDKEQVHFSVRLDGRDAKECKVDFDETPTGVRVYSHHARHSGSHSTNLKFEIKVPKKFDIEIESNGGEISIANVEGTMRGRTMGGRLDLTKLKGYVDLKTMGGDITVTDSDLNGEVKTNGGDVLIQDVTGGLRGSSMGGQMIRKNVTTMGGNIRVNSVDGTVQATTMAGDINITLVGDPEKGDRSVKLKSMSGDVQLTVPSNLSMAVDITLAYTKESSRDYKILSDFPIQLDSTKKWDHSQGSPRKYIYGAGTVAGGKNKLKIETVNGDVYLKKGSN
jgi:DUF4097 and DUF4098 domain-containing protein YvlB